MTPTDLATLAQQLHEAGAIRPDHAQAFSSFRVSIGQAIDRAAERERLLDQAVAELAASQARVQALELAAATAPQA